MDTTVKSEFSHTTFKNSQGNYPKWMSKKKVIITPDWLIQMMVISDWFLQIQTLKKMNQKKIKIKKATKKATKKSNQKKESNQMEAKSDDVIDLGS